METWLPLSTPYPMVPLLTPYDLPFSRNTSVTDDRRTTTVLKTPYTASL